MTDNPNIAAADALAEWKALKPGRKVLEIETFTVLTVKKADSNGIDFYGDWIGYDRLTDKRAYQLLHEGPFDAWKLQPGDWFWISEPFKEWVRFNHSKPNGLISIINGNIVYTCYPYKTSFHFYPPTLLRWEERIEKATEKIWHLIDRAANQSTVAKEEVHAILTELMEGKS